MYRLFPLESRMFACILSPGRVDLQSSAASLQGPDLLARHNYVHQQLLHDKASFERHPFLLDSTI
jgi:hypothetical protein